MKSLAIACGFIHLECLGAFGNGHVSCVRTFFKDEKRGRLSILGIMDVGISGLRDGFVHQLV